MVDNKVLNDHSQSILNSRAIIIGRHQIADSLLRQYERRGYVVSRQEKLSSDGININEYDELCLLASNNEDNKAISLLEKFAEDFDKMKHDDKRLLCHLLVQECKTIQMLQKCDFCDSIRQKIDVYPFTMEEIWSHSIVLDYEPITIRSDKHVHLVIFGMDEVAETVAIQTAHIAHYPNYVRNHSLRTRITMIDENAKSLSERFIKRYCHLFDNCYYRIVNPSEEIMVKVFHKPMYEGKREDFVDVEWEFVDAEFWNPDVREKLKQWARDDSQLLTVVMADKNEDKNVVMSLFIPDELYQRSIPIYKYSPTSEYDVSMPIVQMAKNVNYIYHRCYHDNIEKWQGKLHISVEISFKERERLWAEQSSVKRLSSIYNAMTIPSKMRSIGLKEEDWEKFYDITQQDIELLAKVEHNRWSVEELILGFRPCTDEEHEKIAADVKSQKAAYKACKIHYDLRAYNELMPDETNKSVQVYDLCLSACLPLIAKTFADQKGGEV